MRRAELWLRESTACPAVGSGSTARGKNLGNQQKITARRSRNRSQRSEIRDLPLRPFVQNSGSVAEFVGRRGKEEASGLQPQSGAS